MNANVAAHAPSRFSRSAIAKLFVTEAGAGEPVVLLHGGGPGATGASNYSRNIDVLADRFRVIVPDLPGYGQSSKDIDLTRPVRRPRLRVRGLLDELGIEKAHLVGNSYGGAAALRLAFDRPDRVDRLILMGPGGIGTTRGLPTEGPEHLFGYYGGDGPSREKLATFIRDYLVYDGSPVPDELIDLRYEASIQPEVVANPPLRRPSVPALRTLLRMDFTRDRRLARLRTPDPGDLGRRRQGQPPLGRALRSLAPCRTATSTSPPAPGTGSSGSTPDLFNSLALDFLGGKEAPDEHPVPAARTPTAPSSARSTWATSWSSPSASPTGAASAPTPIGLHVDELTEDVLRFRLDDRECRFLIQRGPAEDLMAIGWQVDDHETFDRIVSAASPSVASPSRRAPPEEAAAARGRATLALRRPQGHRAGDLHHAADDRRSPCAWSAAAS